MELSLHGRLSIKDAHGGMILQFDATGGVGASVAVPREHYQVLDALRSFRSSLMPKMVETNNAVSDPWVREVYELTTRFNQLTGLKVVIHDLLDAFFVTSMKDVEADERNAFKARLVERLEQLAPGWNK